jgi:hypothetical protein
MYNGDPADFAAPVTPNDVTEFAQPMRSLYIGTTGNVAVLTTNGQSVIFANVPVGILPIRCRRVNATGTTATNIIGLW